jgi:RNA polymerase sigma factor (sigma-70 family)
MTGKEDAAKFWLNSAGRYPLLSKTQVIGLARQIQKNPVGSKRRQKAIDKLVCHNLRLIPKVAYRALKAKFSRSFPLTLSEDLFQSGAIGLRRAAELFDPSKGYAFSTYAVGWIYQSVQRDLYNNMSLIRVPENTIREYCHFHKAIKNGASAGDYEQKKVDRYMDCAAALLCISGDTTWFNEEEGDGLSSILTSFGLEESSGPLESFEEMLALSSAPDLAKTMVEDKILYGRTVSEIAEANNTTVEEVNELIQQCFTDLRGKLSLV